ncbi:MAG TPA: hypothetical protein VLU54_11345 [Casimicrobiaceae bacterium]|nr:hypothetical protein [Casimicrobiaceae bacterium]
MSRLPGRLNLFQATMLDWRDQHPYVAVHALRIGGPLDRRGLVSAIEAELVHSGLTGLELDRVHRRYGWHGGPAGVALQVVDAGADWRGQLEQEIERLMNTPFESHGRFDPFRFFALTTADAFFLGLAYDHFIAGGDSIVALLNAVVARYAGHPADCAPPERYPRTHRPLFARHPLQLARAMTRMPAMAQSCRRTMRPRYRAIEEGHNGFALFVLEPSELATLLAAAKRWGVTFNDVLLALLLLAQAERSPERLQAARRRELAVASIVNLRDAHGSAAKGAFGQFLSSFRVSHPVPPGTTLEALATDVHGETSRIKRDRLYLATLLAMRIDRVIGHFQTPRQRAGIYAKSYPVGAGTSTLNIDALWRPAPGVPVPLYVRGVPTGPLAPIVLAATTSNDTMHAGVSYRTAAVERDEIDRMWGEIVERIRTLK